MDKYFSGYIISARLVCLYDKLRELSYNSMDDTDEYNQIINEIKRIIKIENEEYDKLEIEEVNFYLDSICRLGIITAIDERYYIKLLNHKKRLSDTPRLDDDSLISLVIDSKMQIDILKKMYELLNRDIADDLEENEFLNELRLYFDASKYAYMTSNNYLEIMALYSNFDVNKIPKLDFYKIEEEFNFKFINESQSIFIDLITFSIDNLFKLDNDDNNVEKVFEMLYSFSEVEVFLEYLNKDSLKIISDYYNQNKKKCKNIVSQVNVKRLINNRKKELTYNM